jgi:hypothetical protein
MTLDERLNVRLSEAVADYVEQQLREEFPNWRIHRQDTGDWIADHPIYGLVHADSPSLLHNRIAAI